MCEGDEITERAKPRIDGIEVGHVIAVVTVRRRVEGQEPNAGCAERFDMIEPVGEPAEITDSVTVRIHEGFDIDAIDDSVLVPEIKHLDPT
jgi:hypothetical protein